jgi:hypothetical protein
MKIFGKPLTEYIRFERYYLLLILVVGLARLGLSLARIPNSVDKYLSVTVLELLGFLLFSVIVYTSGFGSYLQLYPVLLLQWIVAQAIIIAGIVISIVTNEDNIFSAPEFSPGKQSGRTWIHAIMHVAVVVIFPIVFWGLGCLIMFVTKKIAPRRA